MSAIQPQLEQRNPHPRDNNILFEESQHKYTITSDADSNYVSATTWVHNHFEGFDPDAVIQRMVGGPNWNEQNKYWGRTPDEIKEIWKENGNTASMAGTLLHAHIEDFYNNSPAPATNRVAVHHYLETNKLTPDSWMSAPEWGYFLQFAENYPDLSAYRTEWRIYDEELKIAGSIDVVFQNPDGTFSIYDWKRAKEITQSGYGAKRNWKMAKTPGLQHIPDSNYWHYALQLNLYKFILERRYGMRIRDLCLVRLHPDNPASTYEHITLPDLTTELRALFGETPLSAPLHTQRLSSSRGQPKTTELCLL
jgi:ATP-dependent exoDNAse (exonuclease V) beta subunit